MNTALVSSEVVDLLSRITGQKLSQRELTPSVIFLTALITVTLKVVFADGKVTDDEKQRLQAVLNRFNIPEESVRQLAKLILRGVQQQKVYCNTDDLLTLTAPLSEPERLLLISFGYQMSLLDRNVDAREQQCLQTIANRLGINPRHLAVLETGLSHQETIELEVLDEVRLLLDPAQFQSLDVVFVKAASDILAALPAKAKQKATQQHTGRSYKELKKFQEYRNQLDNHCYQLFQIIQESHNRGVLLDTLTQQVDKVSHKLQSQRFRLAVVGEVSQGKSTFLNALLGEEIQPVRVIPCSGTVTVLKYGSQKRVICCYKDGRQEEIPFDEYRVKAAISEEAALNSERDELEGSDIEEIIFEHPDLDLCSSGVEIVDSPGLNECLDSTKITEKLLKDTDVVLFLTNASHSLTQWERNKISDLRRQLNGGKEDEPADNLFVLVNFMDLLRREEDRQDVRQRIQKFVQGQNPIIKGENRVHFISAQAALDAILDGTEDEYLKMFQSFTNSIEKFLTLERGSLTIKQSAIKLDKIIQDILSVFQKTEDKWNSKVKSFELQKQEIIEKIGELSGHAVKIKFTLYENMNQLKAQLVEEITEAWNDWIKVGGLLEYRLFTKAEKWSSDRDPVWDQNGIIEDYIKLFIKDLSNEINIWANEDFTENLKRKIEVFDSEFSLKIKLIAQGLYVYDKYAHSFKSKKFNFDFDVSQKGWYGDLWRWITCTLYIGYFFGSDYEIKKQMKGKVIQECLAQFRKLSSEVFKEIYGVIPSAFESRLKSVDEIAAAAISSCEARLEQQETEYRKVLEECEAEKAWLDPQRQELVRVQKGIEAILNQCAG